MFHSLPGIEMKKRKKKKKKGGWGGSEVKWRTSVPISRVIFACYLFLSISLSARSLAALEIIRVPESDSTSLLNHSVLVRAFFFFSFFSFIYFCHCVRHFMTLPESPLPQYNRPSTLCKDNGPAAQANFPAAERISTVVRASKHLKKKKNVSLPLFFCLSVCLSLSLSVCLFVSVSVCLSVCLFVCRSYFFLLRKAVFKKKNFFKF